MSSDSISSLILFIAAMLVAAGVAGTLVTNVQQISGSIDAHGLDVREGIETDVEIISDPGSGAVYDGEGNVTLLVKNTGDRTLPTDGAGLDVLVDGEYVPRDAVALSVLDGGSWRPDAVVELAIEAALEPGEHRIVVVVESDREEFEYYYE